MRFCSNCGRLIKSGYTRCYRCYTARKRGNWHDPEKIPGIEISDSQDQQKKFHVYLLDTTYGHYVGHTGNLGARLNAHKRGEVPSTAGGNPRKLWQSYPMATRADAAQFEAALKSWCDNEKSEFKERTGYSPIPFHNPNVSSVRFSPARFSRNVGLRGCFLNALIIIMVVLVWIFFLTFIK